MEVEEIQTQVCKFSTVLRNNGRDVNDDDEDDGAEIKTALNVNGGVAAGDNGNGVRLREWHPSSRIIRVSRASGGKDRHSKVLTSKGSRDRRVRLSVTTAIQFYDLQDRLGYDQPSKAVEWLIKAASEAINELPSLNGANFPETAPNQLSDEKIRGMGSDDHEQGFDDSADVDDQLDGDPSNFGQNQNQSQHLLSKSACSSTSDTSKGSAGGLSLSRSDARVKARERARERAAKEKENENHHNVQNHNNSSSFTDLLTGASGNSSPHQNPRQWGQPMDYFSSGLLNTRAQHNYQSLPPQFNETQFSFVPDHLVPATTTGGDYNLINFNLAGFNRGTLQSNSTSSPSLNFAQHPHNRYAAPPNLGGSNLSFFNIGNSTPPPSTLENHHHHHQFPLGLDARGLQLLYGDGSRHSDQKGKGKH